MVPEWRATAPNAIRARPTPLAAADARSAPARHPRPGFWAGATGIVLVLGGLFRLCAGGWLTWLGGSAYYLVSGAALSATWVLMLRGRPAALAVYGATLAATLLWSPWDVGLDGWQLLLRLVVPAVLGEWMCLPWVGGRLVRPEPVPGHDSIVTLTGMSMAQLSEKPKCIS